MQSENEIIPEYLSKYIDVDTLHKIFVSNSLMFSDPSSFNDPFDCELPVDFDNTEEELMEYFSEIRKTHAKLPFDEIFSDYPPEIANLGEDITIKWLAETHAHNHDKLFSEVQGTLEKLKDMMGICCFTLNETNILMWSHYADKHKGVCLKFDTSKQPDFFDRLIKIEYQPEYPFYNFIRDKKGFQRHRVAIKSIDWEYEQEYRVLKKEKGLIKFDPKCLVEIMFGLRTEDEDIEIIKDYCKRTEFVHVNLKRAKKSDNKFGIEFTNL